MASLSVEWPPLGGIIPLLESPSLKISHNGMFDWLRLRRAGVRLEGPFWCTMIAQQVIDPDAPGYDLESVASYWLDLHRWKHKGAPKYKPRPLKRREWKRLFICASCSELATSGHGKKETRICETCASAQDFRRFTAWAEESFIYNRQDANVLIPLQQAQDRALRRTNQTELFKKMMDVLEQVLLPLQARGLLIDPKARTRAQEHYRQESIRAKRVWDDIAPDTAPSSPTALKQLFYEAWGLPHQFSGKRLTTDATAIHTLAEHADGDQKEALEALLTYRRSRKWLETYTKVADRIYPAYSPATKDRARGSERFGAIAATGRIIAKGDLSTKTPPLQQIPMDLRDLIVPQFKHVFVGADYKSQELRLIAAHTGCAWLNKNLDTVFDRIGDKYGIDRTRAKNLFYGLWAYGGSSRAGQRALKQQGFEISTDECDQFIRDGYDLVPEIFRWHRTILESVERTGFLRNSFGRIRRFRHLKTQRNEALNFPIQSDGADIQWEILIPCDKLAQRYGGTTAILLHDGFYWEIPNENAVAFSEHLRREMTREFPNIASGFRCPVEIKIGKNWKEVS